MMFDGAFIYVRFYAMFFMIVGMNMRYLELLNLSRLNVEKGVAKDGIGFRA